MLFINTILLITIFTLGVPYSKVLSYFSNESIEDLWIRNPYYQYFCIEAEFQWHFPCYPSDLVHFRKRIGEERDRVDFQNVN